MRLYDNAMRDTPVCVVVFLLLYAGRPARSDDTYRYHMSLCLALPSVSHAASTRHQRHPLKLTLSSLALVMYRPQYLHMLRPEYKWTVTSKRHLRSKGGKERLRN